MQDRIQLTHPWLVAVWPGMGHVAVNAGVYMLSKLGMVQVAEVETGDLFDVDAVDVEDGIVRPARRPRSRFFLWADPQKRHDLLVFVGEAQPPAGRFAFCRRVVEFAKQLGVERVFTFAAMATRMHPSDRSRVFAAATDAANLEEMKRLELDVLKDGQIGGLNGVLLGAAADAGLHGACLLGEMPHIFAQIPFPKASHAILEAFTVLAGIDLDLTELAEHARNVDEQLGEVLAHIEEQGEDESDEDAEEADEAEDAEEVGDVEEGVGYVTEETEHAAEPEDERSAVRGRLEELFAAASSDRSKAFELKQELDRAGLFKEFEDRFLDLFKKS